MTSLLFYEEYVKIHQEDRAHPPLFSLYSDHEGLINCRKTFIEVADPTGYRWVQQYLDGDTEFFDLLLEKKWFKEAYQKWQRELDVKLKSESFEKIREIAETKSPQAFQANKYLNKEEWKDGPARGRPTKEEAKGELKKAMEQLSQEDHDLARIGGLKVISGGKSS